MLFPLWPNLWLQLRLGEICGGALFACLRVCMQHTITWCEALPLPLPSMNRDVASAPSHQSSRVPLHHSLSNFHWGEKGVAVSVFYGFREKHVSKLWLTVCNLGCDQNVRLSLMCMPTSGVTGWHTGVNSQWFGYKCVQLLQWHYLQYLYVSNTFAWIDCG